MELLCNNRGKKPIYSSYFDAMSGNCNSPKQNELQIFLKLRKLWRCTVRGPTSSLDSITSRWKVPVVHK